MILGYLSSVHKASSPTRWLAHRIAAWAVRDERSRMVGSVDALSLQRLLCLLVMVLGLAFGTVYEILDADEASLMMAELGLGVSALVGIVLSYRSAWMQAHFTAFVRTLCFGTACWFIARAGLNQFAANHAVGLLFIIPGIGVGYSVSLEKIWPLSVYFMGAIAAAVATLWMVPQPAIAPGLFIGSLVCISAVTLLVAAARLRAQKRFMDSEERYRAVVEQASDGIYLLDASTLRFLDANPAFQRMVGYTLGELQQMTLVDLVAIDAGDGRSRMNAILGGAQAHVAERVLLRKDGSRLCVELHVDRIAHDGRDVLSVVVRDVSLRKQYEASLIAAKEHAEAIARFKSSLLTNMSHEIRTPLSSILGWSAVLVDEVSDQQRELVALIEQSGKRLHNTLDAVLELAHLDANGKQVHPVVLNVKDELADVVEGLKSQAERKGIALSFTGPERRVWVESDPSCLRRIVTHLVDNAVKFTRVGRVDVDVTTTDRELRIQVRDTGIGIGEAFLPHLFEEFKQESEGLARQHEGNGLGLAITQRLVELLGGTITVESRKGAGSCFTVRLPGVVLSGEATIVHARVA